MGLASAGPLPASRGQDTSDPLTLHADCIHAWSHPCVGLAYNAFFIGLPFGPVRSSAPTEDHWLLRHPVDCRQNRADHCARFGPSPHRVPVATFIVNWITSRVDVIGRRYTVISNPSFSTRPIQRRFSRFDCLETGVVVGGWVLKHAVVETKCLLKRAPLPTMRPHHVSAMQSALEGR